MVNQPNDLAHVMAPGQKTLAEYEEENKAALETRHRKKKQEKATVTAASRQLQGIPQA